MMVLRKSLPGIICVFLFLCGSSPALAARVTDLASAFDEDDPYDFNLLVGYNRTLKRGLIQRELSGNEGGILMAKDIRFSQVRHVLNIRADAAVWKDLQVHVEIPIVLSDIREMSFAQNDGDPCGINAPEENCITWKNSTLVNDGFLNRDGTMTDDQVKVAGPPGEGPAADGSYPGGFELPERSGLDQIHLGITYALLSQARDVSKPTWTLGFEARIAVGDYMQYNPYYDQNKTSPSYQVSHPGCKDPADPTKLCIPPHQAVVHNPKGNDTVGRGLHQFHWYTVISKRFKYVDPYFGLYYIFPLAKEDSLFHRTSFDLSGQERHDPIHRGGVDAGLEIVPWERPRKTMKLSIEIRGKLEGVFEGRGYTDIWELFANNPNLVGGCYPSGSNVCKASGAWNNNIYCNNNICSDKIPYPGITSVENHVLISGLMAINLEMTKWFRAQVGVGFGHEQSHYITFGDAGKNIDDQAGIQHTNLGEVNPMYRPYIDGTGRRFRVADSTIFDVFANIQARF